MTDDDALARLDSFPYRTRIDAVMSTPLVKADRSASLATVAAQMCAGAISSVVVDDPDGAGIVTERDVLRAVAEGGGALDQPVGRRMSRPLATVRADDRLYVALGRMDRLRLRHLVVVDDAGTMVGMLSARALLKLRSKGALAIGDAIGAAADAAGIAAARAELPALARALRADGATGLEVAGVISASLRDATARAGELAAAAMAAEGWGDAPAPWCLLVLGSGGRGESLLVPDQDNALVHGGSAADDSWFAELGRRVADILDAAGVPYCAGGVMAREPAWRQPLDGWRATIRRWIAEKQGEALLSVDIFFDFRPVLGDGALARALRVAAVEAAAGAPLFLRLLAEQLSGLNAPLGFFGGIKTREGRTDLKLGGTLPIVSAARALALAVGSHETATPARLAAAAAAGRIGEEEAGDLAAALETVVAAILDDQLAAVAAGETPSVRIVPGRFRRARRRALAEALGEISPLYDMVKDAVAAR